MTDWKLTFVLPNFHLADPIEGGEIALVPHDDPRLTALERLHPNVKSFLDCFTNQFTSPLHPNAMLVCADAPKSAFTVEAISGFRDLIVMSVIPYNRSRALGHSNHDYIFWSDFFDFYPWWLDAEKGYKWLLAHTPGFSGVDSVKRFAGQSSPSVAASLAKIDDEFCPAIDKPLLKTLIEKWRNSFLSKDSSTADTQLFRSLNMANHAGRIPASPETTIYDVGRSIALWISAFEILAHPGKSEVTGSHVIDLLNNKHWLSPELKHRRFWRKRNKAKPREHFTFAGSLYHQVYEARNHFLHGNRVALDTLKVKQSGHPLFYYAGPLYRMALSGFLCLSPPETYWEQWSPEE